ncbi:hypothetical protein V498_00414 [Pseudogymnoascus sp. VKM F-4517 (FW-2822)]|nr:hypothetical protein V498_00414 [Pseudogymnoascus sp. VKM F-4517 (FW-2822)]
MRSFISPLSYGLIFASFMVSQTHLATAACTNTTTFVYQSIQTQLEGEDRYRNYHDETHLDFISCPSSGNVGCTFPAKNYTFTVAPQYNISATNSSFKDLDWKGLDALMGVSQTLDLPLNSSDRKAINGYIEGVWEGRPEWHLVLSPIAVTMTSENISSYVNLTVDPGYNMTLTYAALRVTQWVLYEHCDNKSLDESLIGGIMPYYTIGPRDTHVAIAGQFLVDRQFLNDTLPEDSSGMGLNAGSGWETMLILFGVLAFNWL